MAHTFSRIIRVMFLTLLLCSLTLNAQDSQYGLKLRSYPSPMSEYTSVLLDKGDPIPTDNKKLTLNMDLLPRVDNMFGTVCRVITDKGGNVDIMYTVNRDDTRMPMLVTGDTTTIVNVPVDYTQWVPVSLSMNPRNGDVTLTYGTQEVTVNYPAFKGTKSVRINFGLCIIPTYQLLDVASVSVRNIALERSGKKLREWKMARHNGDVCYDEINGSPALVTNGIWLYDAASTWTPIYQQHFSYFPSVAFDPIPATFYLAYKEKDDLYVFHSTENVTDTIRMKGGEFAALYPNQLIYIPSMHRLLSYNIDEEIFSTFNPISHTWENNVKSTKDHDYWNNTLIYNPADTSLVSFGGYGHFRYNNTLLTIFPYSDRQQKAKILSEIHPRYSSSSVLVDSLMYIFGGRGCPSGRQELSPHNYYDMYTVNLKTYEVKKLWDLGESPFGNEFMPGENMIYHPETNSMWMWATLHGGTLLKVSLDNGKFEQMSLPMNETIDGQTFYANLYHSPDQHKFYAVLIKSDIDGNSDVSIFSMSSTPKTVESLTQGESFKPTGTENKIGKWILYLLIALLIGVGIWRFTYPRLHSKKKNRNESATKTDTDKEYTAISPDTQDSETDIKYENLTEENNIEYIPDCATTGIETPQCISKYYDLNRGCIRFLGGFRAYDKDGEDITPLFTPTLKQLLILLVLHTGGNPMGIANSKLLNILWGNKDDEAAKNNRNVYLSRLRNLLSRIGDVTVKTQSGFRSIRLGEGVVCDYLEILKLLESDDETRRDRVLELLFHGVLLPNTEYDYVDAFKSMFSNRTIDFLTEALHQDNLGFDTRLHIADTILQHDYLNEEALQIKCRLLHERGRTGVAKTVYAAFCREYKSLMGDEYGVTFTEIIEK